MLISYKWLRALTGTSLTPEELRERLTMVGLAIDSVAEVNGDSVLDVEVPSNRPDCLSHVGIAREVAVIEKGKVSLPEQKQFPVRDAAEKFTSVEIVAPDLCPRYSARLVRGVKIAPSPQWMITRLEEIGQRPVNNVADITNYVLHELGQPLHAFDFAKLVGQRIIVRRANNRETIQTLDGVERKLTSDMLVIADAERPVALAGIMGGENSEISAATTDVLIESAYFDPDTVRKTARHLAMDTEASRRFERGADRENVLRAQARCIELICEIAGGTATENAIDVYPEPLPLRTIGFRPARVESLTSVSMELPEMMRILSGLGFITKETSGHLLNYTVPSWRVDVSREEDLIEEVIRHAGYDKIGSELPPVTGGGEYQNGEMQRRALRRALSHIGFNEAINFSFINAGVDEQFQLIPALSEGSQSASAKSVTLKNPILEGATEMRLTLLPGLLSSVRTNLNHGVRDVSLFEIGRIFAESEGGDLPVEREALGLITCGKSIEHGRAEASRDLDFYDLKGALESAIDAMKLPPLCFAPQSIKHLRQGQAAGVFLTDSTLVGSIGRLSEAIAANYKFRQPIYVAEIDLTAMLGSPARVVHYTHLPKFPSVVRDLTILLDRKFAFADLHDTIRDLALADYRGTRLVGTYEGESLPPTKRAITVRVEYRADDRTLRDEEVEERHRNLVQSIIKKFDAEQR